MVNFCLANCMANDDFSEPPRRADSKNAVFIFFADFWVWVTSEARGSVLVGFWGARQLSPFFGGGGSSQGALLTPAPSIASPAAPVVMHPSTGGRSGPAWPSDRAEGHWSGGSQVHGQESLLMWPAFGGVTCVVSAERPPPQDRHCGAPLPSRRKARVALLCRPRRPALRQHHRRPFAGHTDPHVRCPARPRVTERPRDTASQQPPIPPRPFPKVSMRQRPPPPHAATIWHIFLSALHTQCLSPVLSYRGGRG